MKRSDNSRYRSKCEIANTKERNKRRNYVKRNNGREEYSKSNKSDMIFEVDSM